MPKKHKDPGSDQEINQISEIIKQHIQSEVTVIVKRESALTREYVDARFSALDSSLDTRFGSLEKSMKQYTHTYVGEAVETIMTGMDSLAQLITKKSQISQL